MLVEARNISLDVPDMSDHVLIGRRRKLRILSNVYSKLQSDQIVCTQSHLI